jgi:hypothetical protein
MKALTETNLTVFPSTFSSLGVISTLRCLIDFETVPLFPLTVITLALTERVTKNS